MVAEEFRLGALKREAVVSIWRLKSQDFSKVCWSLLCQGICLNHVWVKSAAWIKSCQSKLPCRTNQKIIPLLDKKVFIKVVEFGGKHFLALSLLLSIFSHFFFHVFFYSFMCAQSDSKNTVNPTEILAIYIVWGPYWQNIGQVLFGLVHKLTKPKEQDQYFPIWTEQSSSMRLLVIYTCRLNCLLLS